MKNKTYETLLETAAGMGAEHGEIAASWYFDGNTTEDTYRAVLQGIEDNDPAILDTFPSAPLSGEWADAPTPATVLDALGVSEDDDAAPEYLDAYEQSFYSASADEIERVARYQLAE